MTIGLRLSETFVRSSSATRRNIRADLPGPEPVPARALRRGSDRLSESRDLEKSGQELSIVQDRMLTDQLVMSYGITGELKKTALSA